MSTLAERIERAYMALEGQDTPRGSRSWFAKQARVRPYTVSRWVQQETPAPRALASIEQLEARAGIEEPSNNA